jgi:hypothetical protein
MRAKNYICTGLGFVKGTKFHDALKQTLVEYTDKIREARPFSTSSAEKFMDFHNLKGFIWKPFEQEAIRDKYTVKKVRMAWKEEKDEKIEEWQPVKIMMSSDSDIAFLMSGKCESDNAMTFEEAKAEALRLNTEMLGELMNKIDNLKTQKENDR